MKHYLTAVSFLLSLLAAAAPVHAASDIVISAPIFPKYISFYNYEAENYPTTEAAKIEIADLGFFNFEELFQMCLADDAYKNKLHIAKNGEPLTQEKLGENYNTIADCAYVKFTSKPYFVPQLVDDVDLCAHALPASQGWRMITDTDINSWDDTVFTNLTETLNSAWPNGGDSWGSFYFSTVTYIRTATGIKIGILRPEAAADRRIIDVPGLPGTRTVHQESISLDLDGKLVDGASITLRCIKAN